MAHYTLGQEQDVKQALKLLGEISNYLGAQVVFLEHISVALEGHLEVSKSVNNALVTIAERLGPLDREDDEWLPPARSMVNVELPEEDTESPEYTKAVLDAAATFETADWEPPPIPNDVDPEVATGGNWPRPDQRRQRVIRDEPQA